MAVPLLFDRVVRIRLVKLGLPQADIAASFCSREQIQNGNNIL